MCLLSFLKWGSIGHSLGIVQWDFTRRDHRGILEGYPGRVLSLKAEQGIYATVEPFPSNSKKHILKFSKFLESIIRITSILIFGFFFLLFVRPEKIPIF